MCVCVCVCVCECVWKQQNCSQFGDFLTGEQTLTHATAHQGCANTVKGLRTESCLGETEMPYRTRELNPRQYCAWLFGPLLYPLSCPVRSTGSRGLQIAGAAIQNRPRMLLSHF